MTFVLAFFASGIAITGCIYASAALATLFRREWPEGFTALGSASIPLGLYAFAWQFSPLENWLILPDTSPIKQPKPKTPRRRARNQRLPASTSPATNRFIHRAFDNTTAHPEFRSTKPAALARIPRHCRLFRLFRLFRLGNTRRRAAKTSEVRG